jgi:hypothetical protein
MIFCTLFDNHAKLNWFDWNPLPKAQQLCYVHCGHMQMMIHNINSVMRTWFATLLALFVCTWHFHRINSHTHHSIFLIFLLFVLQVCSQNPSCAFSKLIVIWINSIRRKRLVTDSYKTNRIFFLVYMEVALQEEGLNEISASPESDGTLTKMSPLISSRIIAICLRSKILLVLYTG